MFDNSMSVPLELLRFPRPFSQSPTFEAALRRRIDELSDFVHPAAATIRSVQWLGIGDGLALVSNQVTGRRLSDAFGLARGPAYALELIRQLTDFVAALERHGAGMAHGAINADRVMITESGKLVVLEHVLGSALGTLYWPPSRTRQALGVAMPFTDKSVFDSRTDVYQVAFLALSVTLGRLVNPTDDVRQAESLLSEACRPGLTRTPISSRLQHWLERALRLDDKSFESAAEAWDAFEHPPDEQPELRPAPPVQLPRVPESEVPLPPPPAAKGEKTAARVTRLRPKGSFRWEDQTNRVADAANEPPSARAWTNVLEGLRRTVDAVPRPRAAWIVPALATVALMEGVVIGVMWLRPSAGAAASIPLTIDSPQPGLAIELDGKPVGVTPLKLAVSSTTKSIRITPDAIAPPPAAAAAPATAMDITSDPPGARVVIDGKPAGVTPVTAPVEPGSHDVVVSAGTASFQRSVTVANGTTATVVASLGAAASGAGWLTIASPVELQVLEGGAVIGTTTAARLMLPAGRHDLMVSSTLLGFQSPLHVDVQNGKSTLATVPVPNGSVSINALPWATVTLDGRDLGTTPIANVDVPLGTHDLILKHPQFGERRQSVLVTAKTPVRLVIDLSKK
jgi:serine/threonine-protein kinase